MSDFPPCDLRPVYVLVVMIKGMNMKLLKMISLKTKKAIVPSLPKVVIAVVNARTDLNYYKHVPNKMLVK